MSCSCQQDGGLVTPVGAESSLPVVMPTFSGEASCQSSARILPRCSELLRWAPFWQPMSRRLRPYAPALALVLVASAIGQLAVLIQTPLVVLVVDSSGYLALTHRIPTTGQFTDPLAATGYPTFMALVFLLAGRDNLSAAGPAEAQACDTRA